MVVVIHNGVCSSDCRDCEEYRRQQTMRFRVVQGSQTFECSLDELLSFGRSAVRNALRLGPGNVAVWGNVQVTRIV